MNCWICGADADADLDGVATCERCTATLRGDHGADARAMVAAARARANGALLRSAQGAARAVNSLRSSRLMAAPMPDDQALQDAKRALEASISRVHDALNDGTISGNTDDWLAYEMRLARVVAWLDEVSR